MSPFRLEEKIMGDFFENEWNIKDCDKTKCFKCGDTMYSINRYFNEKICNECIKKYNIKTFISNDFGEGNFNTVSLLDYIKIVEENRKLKNENKVLNWNTEELFRLTKYIYEEKVESKKPEMSVVSGVIKIIEELEEKNERLKEELQGQKEMTMQYYLYSGKKENDKLRKELESIRKICNDRGKNIEELENKLDNLKECEENTLSEFRDVEELRMENEELKMESQEWYENARDLNYMVSDKNIEIEKLKKEIEEMRNNIVEVKCCQQCQIYGYNRYINQNVFTNKNIIIKNVLSEDCEICKYEESKIENKEKFIEITENTNYEFKDSWALWYKVEGMDKAVAQYNLTKEECEIIYGNINNITYWHMEVMK